MHACIIHYIVDRIYLIFQNLQASPVANQNGFTVQHSAQLALHTGMPYLGSLSASFPWAVRNAMAQRYSERNSASDRMHTPGEELGMHCHAVNEVKLDEGESMIYRYMRYWNCIYYILHMHVCICIQKCVAAQTPCDDEMTMHA